MFLTHPYGEEYLKGGYKKAEKHAVIGQRLTDLN